MCPLHLRAGFFSLDNLEMDGLPISQNSPACIKIKDLGVSHPQKVAAQFFGTFPDLQLRRRASLVGFNQPHRQGISIPLQRNSAWIKGLLWNSAHLGEDN